MFKKIKLGSTFAALILFAFPWIDIQCSGKSFATQTGFQVIYGGASPAGEMELTGEAQKSEESLGSAPLVALALCAVIGGVVFSFLAILGGSKRADVVSSFFATAALLLLVGQLMIGFPAKKEVMKAAFGENPEAIEGGAGLPASKMSPYMLNFQVKVMPMFYLELILLGIPTLLLANRLIDRCNKDSA